MSTSNSVLNMILDDSDSDEELEMLAIIALEEERLNQESQPRRRGSIQDEGELVGLDYDYDTTDKSPPPATVSHERTTELCELIQMHRRIMDRETRSQLQEDLVEHLWELHGDS